MQKLGRVCLAEAHELMFADERLRRFIHCLGVDLGPHPPGMVPGKDRACIPVCDAIAVGSRLGIEARREARGSAVEPSDGYVIRRQRREATSKPPALERTLLRRHRKAHMLREGVYPSIGPASA